MADAPQYTPQVNAPSGISFTVEPAPLPGVPSVGPAPTDSSLGAALDAQGSAIGKIGTEIAAVGAKVADAQDETQAAIARTKYMEKINDLRNTYTRSNDFKNAETDFKRDAADARMELLGGIQNPNRRAQTALHMEVQAISGQQDVRSTMLGKEGDTNRATLNDRVAGYSRDAAAAATPEARAAVFQSAAADIQQQVQAGWVHASDAERTMLTMRETVAGIDARRLIEKNPAAAAAALKDPKQFPDLSPQNRQNLVDQANNASDQATVQHWATIAQFNPTQAIGTIGIASTPSQADKVFQNGIMPTENGPRDNKLVSSAGAVGLSQIMPQTAVGVAKQLGLTVFKGIEQDDAAITEKLKADPALNVQLGKTYFQSMVARYAGNVAVAAAAYNAGPDRADKWLQQATQKFGPNFSAAQFQSVVGIPETHDYIAKVWKNLGADPNGAGLTTLGQLHGAAAITTAINAADALELRQLSAAAKISRDGNDFADQFKNGLMVDPALYQTAMQTNLQAARAGDQTSAEWVRQTQLQESLAPMRDQAYRMSPAHLQQTVSQMQEFLQTHPVQPGDMTRLTALKEVLNDVTTRAKSDPVALAERAKIIHTPVVIDPKAEPTDPTLGTSLAIRSAQAQAAQQFYGGDLKILKSDETAAWKDRYSEASADDKFAILRTAGSALQGRPLQAFLDQVGGGNSGVVLAGMMANDRPEIARQIVQGTELLKSKETQANAKAVRPAFADKLAGQVYPDPDMQHAVEGAALALYVSRAAQNGTLYADTPDAREVEKAIEDVTGPIVKRNGMKVPISPSLDPGRFTGALDHLSDADVRLMGGATDGAGKPVAASDISNYGVLRPLAIGSPLYVVGMRDARARDGFRPLFTDSASDGTASRPLVFNMGVLTRQAAPTPAATPYQAANQRFRSMAWQRYRQSLQEAQQ